MKCCFATVVTKSKYEVSAGRLYQSLKYFNSKYPLEILVDSTLLDKELPFLVKNNIPFRKIKVLKFKSAQEKSYNLRFNDTLTKFQLLNLTEYDYICFLDADILIDGSIDILLDKIPEFDTPIFCFYNKTDFIAAKDRPEAEIFYLKPSSNNYLQFIQFFHQVHNVFSEFSNSIADDELFIRQYYDNCIFKDANYIEYFINNYNTSLSIYHFSGPIKIWQLCDIFAIFYRIFYCIEIKDFIQILKDLHKFASFFSAYILNYTTNLCHDFAQFIEGQSTNFTIAEKYKDPDYFSSLLKKYHNS